MSLDTGVHLKDSKGSQNKLIEAIGAEKQLWALVHSKGLLHTEVLASYRSVRSLYEEIILNDDGKLQLHDVEYSLWKLHYKHIDEFRKRIRQNSASSESHMEKFKLFLSGATEFYEDLITKLRRLSGLSVDSSSDGNRGVSGAEETKKLQKCQYSCHRFLVCLGDLARYRELCKKMDLQRLDWSVAANYYFKAALSWPDSGNPHNQLALLATYVGDDFLALYHCIRSLAVREPFPDAWNNLILLFEKNRSCNLSGLSKESGFNFSNPCERSSSPSVSESNRGSMNNDACLAPHEHISPANSCLWPLFVRLTSFFFIESSLEDFSSTFASTMKELDLLLGLDDSDLTASLEPYQSLDSTRKGPYRALQMVCALVFIVHSLTLEGPVEKNYFQRQPMLIESAISSTFIFVARLVERCLKGNDPIHSPLLPAVLVFVEWLNGVLDDIETYIGYEKVGTAFSYFISTFVDLLNQLDNRVVQEDSALWEDYELRGFVPLAHTHGSLDFMTSPRRDDFSFGITIRGSRILEAAMRTVERSGNREKWIFYDSSEKRFKKCRGIAEPEAKEHQNGAEEEEVILFRPLTRYNSEPISTSGGDDEKFCGATNDTKMASDELLRRATSLFLEQTRSNGSMKQQEPVSFPVRPPSLSSWVVDRESPNNEKEKATTKDFFKPSLSPIEEAASASLTGLFISETEDAAAQISHSTPVPSAPLLPDDATWYNGMSSKEPDGILGAPPRSSTSYMDWLPPLGPLGMSPTIPGPPLLSSSEWLHQYTSQNLDRGIHQVWPLGPVHLYGPGNYYGNDGSRFDLCDRWGNPLSSNGMVYLESPQVHLGSPLVYGGDEQRKERLFHNYQRPAPYVCGGVTDLKAEQPPPLLHYLKEKEWQLQRQAQVRGPPYMGN